MMKDYDIVDFVIIDQLVEYFVKEFLCFVLIGMNCNKTISNGKFD